MSAHTTVGAWAGSYTRVPTETRRDAGVGKAAAGIRTPRRTGGFAASWPEQPPPPPPFPPPLPTALAGDGLDCRPSAAELIPELGMGGDAARVLRLSVPDEARPRDSIERAVAEYRRAVLGVSDRRCITMGLESYRQIPLPALG